MKSLTTGQLEWLHAALEQERRSLEERLEQNGHFGLADRMGSTTGELSAYDNHPADLGSEMFERGKDIALNEHAENQLSDVTEALARMNDGTYGRCVVCGGEIPFERLQAKPETEYCFEHVPDRDMSERRPVEEQVLRHPFGRHDFDGRDDETEFDGEDAWQIVASWGTSNTPAMAENPNVDDYNDVESDENEGFVESYESFVATDMYGEHVTVVRNRQYREYMEHNEGDPLLEPDTYESEDDWPPKVQ